MKAFYIPAIIILLLLHTFVIADMGAHPEAEFSVTIDGKPFNNALVSLQECQEGKRYSSSDYSIAGLGEASRISFENNFLINILEPDETGNYMGRQEIEGYKNEYLSYAGSLDIPWNDEQLQQARNFILDEFDGQKQCYWQPSERAFTDCENTTCKATYRVPSSFRIRVLDLDTGKTYITEEIERAGLNTIFAVDFDSSSGIGYVAPSKKKMSDISLAAIVFPPVFIINLTIELLAAFALGYFAFKIKIKRVILPTIFGNIVTHPLTYFIPQLFNFSAVILIVLGMDIVVFSLETFAVLFEAFLITKMAKVKWKQAVILSLIVNIISFFIGAFITF